METVPENSLSETEAERRTDRVRFARCSAAGTAEQLAWKEWRQLKQKFLQLGVGAGRGEGDHF